MSTRVDIASRLFSTRPIVWVAVPGGGRLVTVCVLWRSLQGEDLALRLTLPPGGELKHAR